MKRYISKQKHNGSCGPIAIMNVMKWHGYSAPYSEFINKIKWCPQRGMYGGWMAEELQLYGFNFREVRKPNFKDIEKAIDSGNSVILMYRWFSVKKGKKRNGGHFVWIRDYNDKYFVAENANRKCPRNLMKREILAKYFRVCGRHEKWGNYPIMWEIKK